jgi:hypothetical protein
MQRSTRYYPMPSILPLENLLEVPILTGVAAADLNRVICHYLEDNEYLHIPHRIYLSGNVLPPLHLSLQDNMLPVTLLNLFSTTVANHGAELTERILPHHSRNHPSWDVFSDAHYPVDSVEYTGWRAVVHAVMPSNLGLPDRDDGRAYLLYAYEGESMASILEGNGFVFPGSDLSTTLLHFQGDEFLSMEQHRLNPYFPSFNHLRTLDIKETVLVPDVTAPDYLQQLDQWVHSDFFNHFHNVPVTHIWNEHRDLVSRVTFHRLMDPYITFQVDSAVVPLQEHIEELGDQCDDLASRLADLQNHYDTLEHILVLDEPSPPTYVSQSSQTTNQDVSGMGKSGDPHHDIDGEKKSGGETSQGFDANLAQNPRQVPESVHNRSPSVVAPAHTPRWSVCM